ncbi:MAG: voltage-gated chloride channel family protein [Deltaproteobacteria bacterium]|nr:voltage-gated chloride channel family protein [Deltaproteobacteria bacterium]
MPFRWNPKEHIIQLGYVLKWAAIVLPVAVAVGSACALFLWTLDQVTNFRGSHPKILFLLPLAGVLVGLLYHYLGRSAEGGHNLIMEQIHEPGGGVPRRMAPLVLIGTTITHLFGGSAGREGTAVQMGGSIASGFSRLMRLDHQDGRTILMAGVAAGFGGIFGTPLSGAIFALEVLAIGRISYEALIPCLMAGVMSDWTCSAWGIHHTQYRMALVDGGGLLLGKVALAAILFGLTSVLFAKLTHGLSHVFKKYVPWPYLRPALGGFLIIGMVSLFGTRDYLGLGVSSPDLGVVTILSSFTQGGAHAWSWLLKILFTVVTLGTGFKGGEVTPLFFIGASLGNTLANLMGAPVELFAALGFVAVFAGATNTPLASTLMGVELFGPHYVVYFAVACFLSYLFSGHSGIYLSQKIAIPKFFSKGFPPNITR